KQNTTIQISTRSFMYSEPKQTWEEYWHQKKRHVTTGRYYRVKHKLLLSVFSVSNILFWLLFIATMIYSGYSVEAFLLFGMKLSIQGIVYRTTLKRFVEDDLFFIYPLMD